MGIQAAAIGAAIVYSGVATFILLKVIGLVMPLRVSSDDENSGLDITLHGEEAYLHPRAALRATKATRPVFFAPLRGARGPGVA